MLFLIGGVIGGKIRLLVSEQKSAFILICCPRTSTKWVASLPFHIKAWKATTAGKPFWQILWVKDGCLVPAPDTHAVHRHRARRELHSFGSRNKAKDCSDWLPPLQSVLKTWKKEKFGFFLKEKGNEGQGEHKNSPKRKGHSLACSKRTKNKKQQLLTRCKRNSNSL